jgi:hypothetical protein
MKHDQRYRTAEGRVLENLPGKNDSIWFRGSPQISPGDLLIDTYQPSQLFMVTTATATTTLPGRPYKVATLVKVNHLVVISRVEPAERNAFGRSMGGFRSVGEGVPLVISGSTIRKVETASLSETLLVYLILVPADVDIVKKDRITFPSGSTYTVEGIDHSQPGLLSLRIIEDRR